MHDSLQALLSARKKKPSALDFLPQLPCLITPKSRRIKNSLVARLGGWG